MKQLIILTTLLVTILSHTAGADDFNVLWEIDLSPHAGYVLVSDDGKYFYYCDSGYVKFHDSETGNLINQIPDRKFLLLGNQDYYLNNDKIVLPFTLDSILVYNIADKRTEETIDLEYNIENVDIDEVSLSPDKRFLTLVCLINGAGHIIIVDLELKKLYKDISAYSDIHQLFNTNDPNRMIVVTSDQHGKHLMEITINDEHPYEYNRNIIEDGGLNGLKYDPINLNFYYDIFRANNWGDIVKYNMVTKNKVILHKDDFRVGNPNTWFNDDYSIAISDIGAIFNFSKEKSNLIKTFDGKTFRFSLCDGFETVLLRDFVSLQKHKLSKIDISGIITNINDGNSTESYLYPNPTTETINLSFTNQHPSIFQYELISNSGQVVQSAGLGYLLLEANSINLDISSIANGHYTLRVFSDREEFVFNVIKGK